jgi:Tol biopolymer transport system component
MRRRRLHGLALAIVAALALLGCSSKSKTTQPVSCDNSGTHLLALASDRNQPAGQFHIYLFDLDALGFHLLSNLASGTAADSSPSLSSDGQLLAFVRGGAGGSSILIYVRQDCGFITRPAMGGGHETGPAFTGNALRLAFARDTLGHRRIRLMNYDGSMVPLGHLGDAVPDDDWAPSPNQDGSRIAFVSNRVTIAHPDGNPHVFVYDVVNDSLLATPGLDSLSSSSFEPSLTPDGRWLAYTSDRAGGAGGLDVYLYDLQNLMLVALPNLNSSGNDRRPSIGAGGNLIVFESDRPGGSGKLDLWNYSRLTAVAPTQTYQESSAGDDLHPSLVWH